MSKSAEKRSPHDEKQPAGAHSLMEIVSQSDCWLACLESLRQSGSLDQVSATFGDAQEWLFIGCGSSYYVALCAAATMATFTGRRARAVPASELLLYPGLVLGPAKNLVPVLISRSGQTSEVLKAAEWLRNHSIPTLAISCAEGQTLQTLASLTVTLPADEKSTVMTRSFSSMLLALQNLAARLGKKSAEAKQLSEMPELAAPTLARLPDIVRTFVANHVFSDYICLGQGPYYGLACEYALKVTEMSVSYAQVFHTLEFRHGPKSVVNPENLLVFLLSEKGYEAEADLLEEMKSLGGTTLVVTNSATERVRANADLLIELALDVPEYLRLAPSLVPGQLLGLYTGLRKGLDPDSPRNLSRAVILDDQTSKKTEHATL